LLRHSFGKIVTLVIAISLLTAGIAPANPSCNAECCVKPKSNGLHSEAHTPPADLLSDCCSGLETAPCPHMLESSPELQEYALAAPAAEVNPARVQIAASVSSALFSSQPHFHLAASMSPNIRGPSVPLYLQTLSLLI
jgi:hypothetical protein